jgi:quinol monooxygenase YgiN
MLRHVVLFAFTETATPAHIQAMEQAFAALPPQIAEIEAFEWGTDASVERLADGYTHCFLVTFASAGDRDAYLAHPAHQAFVARLQPHLAKTLVIDYWASRLQAAPAPRAARSSP